MSKAIITESYLTGIANAIRAKLGVQDTYTPPQMAVAIQAIPTGGITPTGTVQITQNGTHDVTQYASANVNVQPNLQSKTVTENGTVVPDQGYDGLSSVVVNVSGGGGNSYFRRLTPLHTDVVGGYISTGNWLVGDTTTRTDVYEVYAGKTYLLVSGSNHGNRFRGAFFTTDVASATSFVSGTSIADYSDPSAYLIGPASRLFIPETNGFIAISKTNESMDGYDSYLFEVNC